MPSAHVASLSAKHASLESRIQTEAQRPMPDTMRLMQLKKEKLKVKEEISRELQ
jgi:hypothetical protein